MKLSLGTTPSSEAGHECHVLATGELRHSKCQLIEPLRTLLGTLAARKVTLNLSGITAFDASGIAWLVRCRTSLLKSRGELVLVEPPAMVRRALKLLGLQPALCPVRTSATIHHPGGKDHTT